MSAYGAKRTLRIADEILARLNLYSIELSSLFSVNAKRFFAPGLSIASRLAKKVTMIATTADALAVGRSDAREVEACSRNVTRSGCYLAHKVSSRIPKICTEARNAIQNAGPVLAKQLAGTRLSWSGRARQRGSSAAFPAPARRFPRSRQRAFHSTGSRSAHRAGSARRTNRPR